MSSNSVGTNYAPVASRPRVFGPPILNRLVTALVTMGALTLVAVFMLPNFYPNTFSRATRATFTLTVIGLACIGTLIVIFWVTNRRIVVTDDRVEVRRPGQLLNSWDRATTGFGTEVTVHRTNGMRTATARTLIVGTAQGQTKVVVPGISRNSFNEMIAILNPVRPVQDPAAPLARVRGQVFTPNRAPVGASMRKLFWASLIVLVASLAIGFGGSVANPDEDAQIMIIAIAGMGGVVAIFLALAGLAARTRYRAIPTSLQAGPGWLRIDETTYPFPTLSSIQVSPPTYDSRKLIIKPVSGRQRMWQMNGTARKGEPVFEEWSAFIGEVVNAAAGTPGLVQLDLD